MTLHERWVGLPIWGKRWLALVGSFCGTIVAIGAAWPFVEPFVPAHREYVRERVMDNAAKIKLGIEPTRIGVIDVQIGIAKSRQAQVKDRLLSLEIELAKVSDAEDRVRKQYQIRELQDEYTTLDGEIKALRHAREH